MSKTYQTIPDMVAELKKLREDKKRLDWLLSDEGHIWAYSVLEHLDGDGRMSIEAIDAAMEASK